MPNIVYKDFSVKHINKNNEIVVFDNFNAEFLKDKVNIIFGACIEQSKKRDNKQNLFHKANLLFVTIPYTN